MVDTVIERWRIISSLALIILFVMMSPVVFSSFDIVLLALIVLTVLGVFASFVGHWFDAGVSIFIFGILLIVRLLFSTVPSQIVLLRTFSILAFLFLNIVLLIGPWTHFVKRLMPVYKHRRHLGVITFFLAWIHSSLALNVYFGGSLATAFQSPFTFLGFTNFFIMLLLALTSWDSIQKGVSFFWWSIIHGISLIVYLLVAAWFLLNISVPLWESIFIVLIAVYWILISPWALPKRLFRVVDGWKQLHVLIYVAYASLIAHVWSGVSSQMSWSISVLFWGFPFIVFASHSYGWYLALKSWYSLLDSSESVIIRDGRKYYYLDDISNFQEGKGYCRTVHDVPLAVFKTEGKVIAMSNKCPHQGGPLCEGRVENGFVVCPWHGRKFGVHDGKAPNELYEGVKYYHVVERAGKVYVRME